MFGFGAVLILLQTGRSPSESVRGAIVHGIVHILPLQSIAPSGAPGTTHAAAFPFEHGVEFFLGLILRVRLLLLGWRICVLVCPLLATGRTVLLLSWVPRCTLLRLCPLSDSVPGRALLGRLRGTGGRGLSL